VLSTRRPQQRISPEIDSAPCRGRSTSIGDLSRARTGETFSDRKLGQSLPGDPDAKRHQLSLERCRALLGAGCSLSPEEVVRLKDRLYMVAEAIVDAIPRRSRGE
jgi:hypothetical protein